MNARIISVANQKGGVGKTTTAVNLAAALAADGRQVLLVDLDPQGNASSGVGCPVRQLELGLYHVLLGDTELAEVLAPTELEGLHLAPSHRDLAGASIELSSLETPHYRLSEVLAPARAVYDYVVVDCPPSLDLLTLNALTASDGVIVTVQCEFYAMEGLSKLSETIETVRDRLNAALVIEGILMTMYDPRTNLCRQVVEEVKGHFGPQVLDTLIPRNIRLSEAPSFGQPCVLYDPPSRGSQAYLRLSREIDARYHAPPAGVVVG